MRLFSDQGRVSPEIGCELMLRLDVAGSPDPNFAQRLQIVGRRCLLGDKGAATVREVCTKLRDAISRSRGVCLQPPRVSASSFQRPWACGPITGAY
jgi:hypothetical protein